MPFSFVVKTTIAPETLWDPNKQNPGITLSNGNLTATCTQTDTGNTVLSTGVQNSGKLYFEIDFTGPDGVYQFSIGICDSATVDENVRAGWGESWAFYPRSTTSGRFYHDGVNLLTLTIPTITNNIIMVATDLDVGKMWVGVDNVWLNSGNPSSGTGSVFDDSSMIGIDMVPIFSGRNDGEIATLNASSDLFTYSHPSGFSAWGS
jgi:hypothetical protein